MDTTNIQTLDVRQRLGELLELVYYRAHQYRILRKNKPMARLVSEPLMQAIEALIAKDSALADTLVLMVNDEMKALINKSRKELSAGQKIPLLDALP